MAKDLIAGMTDYSHQSLKDILSDLNNEMSNTINYKAKIQKNQKELIDNSYWGNNVPYDFKSGTQYSIKFFETVVSELSDIIKELKIEIKKNHIDRLETLSKVACKNYTGTGRYWKQDYSPKDYEDQDFQKICRIYEDIRNMCANLFDLENIALRLTDFIGKTNDMKKNNPWISGSFYLFVFGAIILGLAALSKSVEWYYFPIIVISGILIISIVGVFQLKNDELIDDKTFFSLIKETFKRLPLINKIK